ncbi:MAG: pyruvate carboxyltransferase [Clostridiales Family XIII bacterium]|jgi:isopropylmalate/homocitrate/citramalate synthase|nr:pyruvate carboxyltransferase [Clostridiales Family XIII bacterium]
MGFREEGKWWVSPSNFDKEVTEKFHFPKKIEFLDTTLRDGEQQAGIILTKAEKVAIAKKLDAVGVHRIEAGTPAVLKEDAEAIQEITSLGLNADIYCFVRNMVQDIEQAKACGVDGVVAEIPGSEHLLAKGKKWGVEKAIASAIEATARAHELGLKVLFFPADSSRASMDFLMDTISAIIDGGGHMDSLALVDTFGALSPEGAARRVSQLIERFPDTPIECHFHDDFGLGVASTLAGLAAGASACHVTVSGIGERAGSASLEQTALALEALYGVDTGLDLSKLKDLAKTVEEYSHNPIPPTYPVVGDRIFMWETGMPSSLWENCKKADPLVMLPYRWDLVGNTEPILDLGKKSGKDNLRVWLERYELDVPEDNKGDLLLAVKEKSLKEHRCLNEGEFRELVAAHA